MRERWPWRRSSSARHADFCASPSCALDCDRLRPKSMSQFRRLSRIRHARHEQRLLLRSARLDFRARPHPASPRRIRPTTKQDASDLIELCEALLSGRGEASGTAMAREVLDRYHHLDEAGRLAFFATLARGLRPGPGKACAGDRELARAAERRRRQRPAFRLRAAAAGTDPPAQPRARRHRRTGGDARRSAQAHERPTRTSPRSTATSCICWPPGSTGDFSCCAGSTGRRPPTSWKRSSATRRCMKSATGTICAAASILSTGAAMPSFIPRWSTSP